MGDIEVKIIGLRPGEKLYEELLIGDNPKKTDHHKIQKIDDPFIPFDQLEFYLNDLLKLLNKNDAKGVRNLLQTLLQSYNSYSEIVDHIYAQQMLTKNKPQHHLSLVKSKNNQAVN